MILYIWNGLPSRSFYMKRLIENTALESVLDQMGIDDISCATIRQSGEIARTLEKSAGVEFLHLDR